MGISYRHLDDLHWLQQRVPHTITARLYYRPSEIWVYFASPNFKQNHIADASWWGVPWQRCGASSWLFQQALGVEGENSSWQSERRASTPLDGRSGLGRAHSQHDEVACSDVPAVQRLVSALGKYAVQSALRCTIRPWYSKNWKIRGYVK
jgi:hypothetical protein